MNLIYYYKQVQLKSELNLIKKDWGCHPWGWNRNGLADMPGLSLCVRLGALHLPWAPAPPSGSRRLGGARAPEDPRRRLTVWRDLPGKGMAGLGRVPSAPALSALTQHLPQPELLTVWAWARETRTGCQWASPRSRPLRQGALTLAALSAVPPAPLSWPGCGQTSQASGLWEPSCSLFCKAPTCRRAFLFFF